MDLVPLKLKAPVNAFWAELSSFQDLTMPELPNQIPDLLIPPSNFSADLAPTTAERCQA